MSSIYSIYKATNTINKKVYIGFDSDWPDRKSDHKRQSKKDNNIKLYNAIKKYGWDNFEWEVLYQSLDGEHCLKVMENYFIVQHRSYIGFEDCWGYNMTLGGEGTLGRKHSKETLEKIIEAAKGRYDGENNPMYNKKHKPESKMKMSRPGPKPKLKETLSKGVYVTPWGSFINTTGAINHPKSFIKYQGTIRDYCLNNKKPRKKYLKGKTPAECGFYFIAKQTVL